jgi:hypothetical protein
LHDPDEMVAMSVIESEIELMTTIMKKVSGSEKEFYASKQSTLQFAKEMIESNIGIGVLTPAKYTNNIKDYLAKQEALL